MVDKKYIMSKDFIPTLHKHIAELNYHQAYAHNLGMQH